VDITVHLCGPTVKQLRHAWQEAVQRGQVRLIRHISALLEVGAGVAIPDVAERVGECRPAWSGRAASSRRRRRRRA
jgi:hypothetical protein